MQLINEAVKDVKEGEVTAVNSLSQAGQANQLSQAGEAKQGSLGAEQKSIESAKDSDVPASANKTKGKAHGQTGPKTVVGKNRSRWNALKDGATAKSSVLPFEDERLYKQHIADVMAALAPSNYVEHTLAREYAEGAWRIIRHEKRGAYERERIFEKLTAPMVADMLGLDERYIKSAPEYLLNLKYKISKKESQLAKHALLEYDHLIDNARHIGNFNMIWRQYQILFEALSVWLPSINPNATPLFSSTGKDLNLAWQQHPKELVQWLERFSDHLFFVAHFEQFKPQIRVWMESWYFLQRTEMRKVDVDEQVLLKERNYVNSILDRLARLRKSTLFASPEVGRA